MLHAVLVGRLTPGNEDPAHIAAPTNFLKIAFPPFGLSISGIIVTHSILYTQMPKRISTTTAFSSLRDDEKVY